MTHLHSVWRRLQPFVLFFLFAETCTRCILFAYNYAVMDHGVWQILKTLLVGILFDIGVCTYCLIPVALVFVAMPAKMQHSRVDRVVFATLFFVFSFSVLFANVGEWFFWDEFQSRYNFIAVDYLVYRREVVGNIRESYPVFPIMGGIAIISLVMSFCLYQNHRYLSGIKQRYRQRAVVTGIIIITAILSFASLQSSYADISNNHYLNELARNGIFELFSAYRHNELKYEKFYATRNENQNIKQLQQDLHITTAAKNPLLRFVSSTEPPHHYNLVLITVESLSADFMTQFGNKEHITPYLDDLAKNSLFFSNLYATGTRTVYGLSALTLSIPPIPGNSIVRRPDNDHLFSLGSVLNQNGYSSKFIYGGYGYFDNMNNFFAGNGYEIVDRSKFRKNEVHFANVWGVSDDDLYDRVLKENDKEYAAKKPFFDMIMTTSNHRPFTYPNGKIDIPSHSGRSGGVKFTDYTIHEFLEKAKTRPWFDNTIFVIVADHTAGSSGKSELDPTKYHIPMFVYAPKIIQSSVVNDMMSQIDVAPTLLGLMGIQYNSQFYGVDILHEKPQRAFISNYQQLGYMTSASLTVLKPVRQADFYDRNSDGSVTAVSDDKHQMLSTAIAYFQSASQWKRWNKQIR